MIKGAKVRLVPAALKDRQNIYRWCFHSETTKSHSGPPDYPEIPIPSYEEFCKQYYEDYFFTGSRPKDGRGFLIMAGGEPVGFTSYSAFHLKPARAELDIWMKNEAACGKGYGTDAVQALGAFLREALAIRELIIAPAAKNTRAVRSYEKAGFVRTGRPMRDFLLEDYLSQYGDGDYGTGGTAILVKRLADPQSEGESHEKS